MSQNINLFDPALRKQRRLLTLGVVAQCLGIMLAALFGYHYYLLQQVAGLQAEAQSADAVLRSQKAYVEQLKAATSAPKGASPVDADIARLEVELGNAREAMAVLKGGEFGSRKGFAEYFRAFSRQSVNGLWLTGFTIAGDGALEIRGRVLSPDLVANYIQRLNQEQVLAGRSFARLEMNRPRPAPAAPGKEEKKAAPPPRFLEFSLATTDVAPAAKMP